MSFAKIIKLKSIKSFKLIQDSMQKWLHHKINVHTVNTDYHKSIIQQA